MSETAASVESNELPQPQIEERNFFHLALIIVVGIFATTLPQTATMGKLPLQHILKGQLHVSPEQMSLFTLLAGLAWYLKPIGGILTDAFPIFGTRRRHYILISCVMAALSWLAVGVLPHTYALLLIGCLIVNLFMVMMSTVVGAVLVEAGQGLGATGRLTAIRQVMFSGCGLIQGVAGGWLATQRFALAAGINACLVFSMFPVTYKYLKEKHQKVDGRQAIHTAGVQLKTIVRSRTMWFVLLLLWLFYFAPGFGTLLYFKQNDELHLSQQNIGILGSMGSGGAVVAAFAYGFLIRKFSIKSLIIVGVGINAIGTLLYLHYSSWNWAMVIETQQGITGGLAEVALIDLAARATPKGCEGLGYSLILSIRNFAGNGADYLGTVLVKHGWKFSTLVTVNAVTTGLALVIVPFIPAILMRSKDLALKG